MWGLAILSTVIMLLLSVPSLIYNLDVMLYSFTGAQGSSLIESLGLNAAGLYNLCNFLSVISLAYKLFLGMFFNKFYANKAVRDIKKIRDQHGQEQDYHMLLTAKGSVSRLYFGLAVVITMVLSTAVSLIVVNLFITTI